VIYLEDAEFIEDGHTIDLISVALVTLDGREFYRENSDADFSRASPWVHENVIPHLTGHAVPHWVIREEIVDFVNQDPTPPMFMGYYADYDWVAICQLFGTMLDLPTGWPKWCYDLKQLAFDKGNPRLPQQAEGAHNSLHDARHNRDVYNFLMALPHAD
jgi:hypothetical protein